MLCIFISIFIKREVFMNACLIHSKLFFLSVGKSWEVPIALQRQYIFEKKRHSYYKLLLPATHPVMKHAALPAIMALRTMEAKSDFRLGAKAPNPPSKIPMEPKLENPHRAYVATTSDLVFGKKNPDENMFTIQWKLIISNSYGPLDLFCYISYSL